MNVRSVVLSTLGPRFFAASLAFVFACGPKGPPKQANIPDPPDPTGESPSGSSGGSAGSNSGGSGGGDVPAPPPAGKAATGGDAAQVSTLVTFTEGLKWGMTHAELTKHYTQTGGVIWKDYDAKLTGARVGPEQTALEAEREQTKAAFSRSYIEFKDTPTGYDSTGLRSEYTYKNKESLMWVQRQGKKRYFFFINDRLWKMYDEVPLVEGGPMGKAFLDAVNKLNGQLGSQGRVQGPDAAKGVTSTTVYWKDGASQLRAVDRSGDHVVGIVVEDSATLSNLAALRPNKPVDPNEIDPSITAVTRGTNRVDPNAATAPAPSASGNKAAPPKKK
jgi:hypothetical protein